MEPLAPIVMKLTEILPKVRGLIEPAMFLSGIPLINAEQANHNQELQKALLDPGLVLVMSLTGGSLKDGSTPLLVMENTVAISVVENPPKNKTGQTSLGIVEQLLQHLHFSLVGKGHGGLRVDTTPYEAGPPEGGLDVYFINLKATTHFA